MHVRWNVCRIAIVLVFCAQLQVSCSRVVTVQRTDDALLRSDIEREVKPRAKWFVGEPSEVDGQTGTFKVLIEVEDLCVERDVDIIERVDVTERTVTDWGWMLASGVGSTVAGGIALGIASTLSDERGSTTVTNAQGQKEDKETSSPQTLTYIFGGLLAAGGVGALSYLGYQAYEASDTRGAPQEVRLVKDERTAPCNRQPVGTGLQVEIRVEPSQNTWTTSTGPDSRVVLDGVQLASVYMASFKPSELRVVLVADRQEIARLSYPSALEQSLAPRRILARREQLQPVIDRLTERVFAGKSFDAETVKAFKESETLCRDYNGMEDLCGISFEVYACYQVKNGGGSYVWQWEQIQKVFQENSHQKLTVACLKQLAKEIEPAYKEALKDERLAAEQNARLEAQSDALEYAYQNAQEVYDRRAAERDALIEELDEAPARILEPAAIKLCRRLIPELKSLIKQGKDYVAKHPDEGVPEHINILISVAQEDYQLAEGIFKHIGLINPGDQGRLQVVFRRECSMK